jgi:NDP-sugar pyrophosphorylase family protein
MKVIITAAGSSKRFKDSGYQTPKMFLKSGDNKYIIEHVMNMFNLDDEFLLLVSSVIMKDCADEINFLSEIYSNLSVQAIDTHSYGPSYTVHRKEVKDFIGDSDFIITYCDFYVQWDYRKFLAHINEECPSGSIVSFSGLQPASLGSTLFAYLRCANGKVQEVREKSSFTSERQNENASTGIYYFSNWDLFSSAYELLISDLEPDAERYVSLIYNYLIANEEPVTFFPVSKFVCLGTPADFEEYAMWFKYFNAETKEAESQMPFADFALIPMAGSGQRFVDEGFRLPKPFIPIEGVPMFLRAMRSLPMVKEFYLMTRNVFSGRIKNTLRTEIEMDKTYILEVNGRTQGPGGTLLEFPSIFKPKRSVVVASCDYDHQFNKHFLRTLIARTEIEGIIFVTSFSKFRMKNPNAFAYCIVNSENIVQSVVEKETISSEPENDQLVVGTFWFRDSFLLKEALEYSRANQLFVNGEIYVGSSINNLISKGHQFITFEVDNWISFGDPYELEIYHWWLDLFEQDSLAN